MEISTDIDGCGAIAQVRRRKKMSRCTIRAVCWRLLANGYLSSDSFCMHNPIHLFMPCTSTVQCPPYYSRFLSPPPLQYFQSSVLSYHWDYYTIRYPFWYFHHNDHSSRLVGHNFIINYNSEFIYFFNPIPILGALCAKLTSLLIFEYEHRDMIALHPICLATPGSP